MFDHIPLLAVPVRRLRPQLAVLVEPTRTRSVLDAVSKTTALDDLFILRYGEGLTRRPDSPAYRRV